MRISHGLIISLRFFLLIHSDVLIAPQLEDLAADLRLAGRTVVDDILALVKEKRDQTETAHPTSYIKVSNTTSRTRSEAKLYRFIFQKRTLTRWLFAVCSSCTLCCRANLVHLHLVLYFIQS